MSLSDRDRKILIGILPLLAIVAYWFLVLAPKREEASAAAEELTVQEERRDKAQANLTAAKGAKKDFSADYTQIVRLGKAIPASVDMPSLIVQLDSAAEGTGIVFTKIKTGERVETPAATPPTGSPTTPPADPSQQTPAAAGGEQAQSAPGGAAEAANTAAAGADQRSAAAEQLRRGPGGHPDLDLLRQRAARGRRHRRHRRPGRGHDDGPRRPGDGAARARVHRQLLQPGRLLPPGQALRARSPTRTWS